MSFQVDNPKVLRRGPSISGPKPEERCGQNADTERVTLGSGHSAWGQAVSGCPGHEKGAKGAQRQEE